MSTHPSYTDANPCALNPDEILEELWKINLSLAANGRWINEVNLYIIDRDGRLNENGGPIWYLSLDKPDNYLSGGETAYIVKRDPPRVHLDVIVQEFFDFLIQDDLRTLDSPTATGFEKGLASGYIVLTIFTGGGGKASKVGVKGAKWADDAALKLSWDDFVKVLKKVKNLIPGLGKQLDTKAVKAGLRNHGLRKETVGHFERMFKESKHSDFDLRRLRDDLDVLKDAAESVSGPVGKHGFQKLMSKLIRRSSKASLGEVANVFHARFLVGKGKPIVQEVFVYGRKEVDVVIPKSGVLHRSGKVDWDGAVVQEMKQLNSNTKLSQYKLWRLLEKGAEQLGAATKTAEAKNAEIFRHLIIDARLVNPKMAKEIITKDDAKNFLGVLNDKGKYTGFWREYAERVDLVSILTRKGTIDLARPGAKIMSDLPSYRPGIALLELPVIPKPEPEPEPSPTPTVTATASPTPVPTLTPSPTNAPPPPTTTPEPKVEPTPTATATPEPTPTPRSTVTPEPTPEPKPLPIVGCSNGVAVRNLDPKSGLVADCKVLLAARDTLTGGAVSLNWSADVPIAYWEGIKLGGSPTRVKVLDLSRRGLVGEIPAVLSQVSELEELLLSRNYLKGEIPSELRQLLDLRSLILFFNRLRGGIPAELGKLGKLAFFSVSQNQLSGNVPPELGGLSELRSLGLADNNLGGAIPSELGGLKNLTFIYLNGNGLSGCLPDGLRDVQFNDFESLNLPFCSESAPTLEPTPEPTTEPTPTATPLPTVTPVPPTVTPAPTNTTAPAPTPEPTPSPTPPTATPEPIPVSTSTPVPTPEPSLTQSSTCSSGVVVVNPEDNPGLVADCEALLTSQETLTGGKVVLNWSSNIPMSNWKGISLGGAPLRVVELNLNGVGLAGGIPARLSGLTELEELLLGGNQLTGHIPSALGKMPKLRYLVLNLNQLAGNIPVALGGLPNLKVLLLEENRLVGAIPRELGKSSSLIVLFLSKNNLTGEIPVEFTALTKLASLHLGENEFSGCIPEALKDVRVHDLDSLGLP